MLLLCCRFESQVDVRKCVAWAIRLRCFCQTAANKRVTERYAMFSLFHRTEFVGMLPLRQPFDSSHRIVSHRQIYIVNKLERRHKWMCIPTHICALSLTFTYTHACFVAYFMYLYVTTTSAAATAAATTTHINGTGYRVIRYIIRFILCDTERLTQLLSVKSRMREEEEEEATVKKVYVNACVRTNTSVQVVPQFAVCVILSVSFFTFLRRSIAAAVAVAVCTSRMGNSTVVNSYWS